jgi:hypothetical protein
MGQRHRRAPFPETKHAGARTISPRARHEPDPHHDLWTTGHRCQPRTTRVAGPPGTGQWRHLVGRGHDECPNGGPRPE